MLRINLLRYLRRSIIWLGSARRIGSLHSIGGTDFHTSVVNGLEKVEAMEKDLFISVARLSDYRFST